MALPGLPLSVVCALLVLTVLAGRPFAASQIALLPEILGGDSYVLGSGLRPRLRPDRPARSASWPAGLVIAAVGVHSCLLIDAATFVVSAVSCGSSCCAVRHRMRAQGSEPASRPDPCVRQCPCIAGDPQLRLLLGLGVLAGLHVVPEGVAPSYAHALGAGSVAVGVLMASLPLGTAVGAWLVVRSQAPDQVQAGSARWRRHGDPPDRVSGQPGIAVSAGLWSFRGCSLPIRCLRARRSCWACRTIGGARWSGSRPPRCSRRRASGSSLFGFVAEHSSAATR